MSKKLRLNIRFTPKEMEFINEIELKTGTSKSEIVRTMFNFAVYIHRSSFIQESFDKFLKNKKED